MCILQKNEKLECLMEETTDTEESNGKLETEN